MHDLEATLGELYKAFAEKFPEYDQLWDKLIQDEQAHAEAIRKLYRLTYDGKALFDEGAVKTYTVQAVLDYVKGIFKNAQAGKYTAREALSIAHDLEKSLLEKNIFKAFKVSDEFASVLNVLHEGVEHHTDITRQELNKLQ